jgi:hypothetical protein
LFTNTNANKKIIFLQKWITSFISSFFFLHSLKNKLSRKFQQLVFFSPFNTA